MAAAAAASSGLKRMSGGARPTPLECRSVVAALAALHGRPNRVDHSAGLQPGCELKEPHTVLDSLVRTILSQNTTDITSQRAYTTLKQAFPAWELVRTAPPGAVEAAIRVGGLADIKASRIKAILDSLLEERGELSLEHLRELPSDDIKTALGRYKGVGPKSTACVMLFCLGRAECPVDTHVWEIAKQMGWVAAAASREATYDYLNAVVPDELKYELHVLLVEHGKVCPQCAKRSTAGKRGSSSSSKAKAAAAAVPCPLAPYKRGASAAAAAAAAAHSLDVAVKLEPGLEAEDGDEAAAAAGVTVKREPGAASVSPPAAAAAAAAGGVSAKAKPLDQFAFDAAAAVKVEPREPAAAAAASRKRVRRR